MTGIEFSSSRATGPNPVSLREALLRGLAPDGGLYVPLRIPPLPHGWEEIENIADLGTAVLEPYLGEPADEVLAGILRDALDFPVQIRELSDERYVLELFHGPTLSFKDFGARTMARLMNHYLAGSGRTVTILVATSGDTGSAVADGFAGLENVRVVLLYPRGMVSDVQERQLCAARPGLTTIAVEGNFDDCQRLVKEAFADPSLSSLALTSANSINVGRLLPQQLYYIWAVGQLRRRGIGDKATPIVSVPSGNLGNLTAGLLATEAGLPVHRFLAAHNANDFFPQFLAERAQPYEFSATVATLSNAMDVGAPSNFERLQALLPENASEWVWGTSVDDEATRARLRQTFDENRYIVCPHTAVGLEAVARYRQTTADDRAALILATAHPAKFPGVVETTIDAQVQPNTRLQRLVDAPQARVSMQDSSESLRSLLLDLGD